MPEYLNRDGGSPAKGGGRQNKKALQKSAHHEWGRPVRAEGDKKAKTLQESSSEGIQAQKKHFKGRPKGEKREL